MIKHRKADEQDGKIIWSDQIFATGQQPEADVLGLQLQLQTCSCKNQTLRSSEVWHPRHPCICHFSFDILVFYVAIQYK